MTELPSEYSRGSQAAGIFSHTLVARDEHKALYEVKHAARGVPPYVTSYELFRVKVQKETDVTLGGTTVHMEAKESLPGDNAFGKWAWSYTGLTKEQALEKYNNLEPLAQREVADEPG